MEHSVIADYSRSPDEWGDQDPLVFEMHIVKTLQGEYQLTNDYGPDEAPKIMMNSSWWIKYDPILPKPFIRCSLQALDNAFTWALNNNMKVILDLYAVPGSQNGNHQSGTIPEFSIHKLQTEAWACLICNQLL
ncbi:hypothetical protein C2S52_000636 [Perilla frutescens var. hirtella]|nr:hypothetical protein C2S52_000636 [Perilla frutescens var. hirtella]